MIKGNRSTLFLQADEIDHLTLGYTDFGEPLDKKTAKDMIHFYDSVYEEVALELNDTATSYPALDEMDEDGLYRVLVRIRDVLLREALD